MNKKSMAVIAGIVLTSMAFQHSTAQSWNITGNSNATSSSKLGTTNNISVRFYTNNTQRMILDAAGKLGIGTDAPIGKVTVQLSGGTPSSDWQGGSISLPAFTAFGEDIATNFNLYTASNSAGFRPVMNFRRSRGSLASPTAVVNNNYLASFVASGYDGADFQNPVSIDFYVDGTPSAGNVPGRISFVTGSNQTNRKQRLVIGNTGSVGIGIATPSSRLQVLGDSLITTPVASITNTFVGNADVRGITVVSKANDGWGYGIDATGGYRGGNFYGNGGAYTGGVIGVYGYASGSAGARYGVYGTAGGGTDNWGGYFPTKTYTNDLRVGGTQGATGYVASINGKLIATEVRVELLANWPDYVFNDNYKLMPLEELSAKIGTDKHLPGIPAAASMKKNGIMLGEMQTKTIEKVEENTLYIIQLNEKIKQLEQKLDELIKSKK